MWWCCCEHQHWNCVCVSTGASDRKWSGSAAQGATSQHHPVDRGGRNSQSAVPGHGARQGCLSLPLPSSSSFGRLYFLYLQMYFWLCFLRVEICLMPSPLPQSTASGMPVPWCITWLAPSSTCTAWTLSTETSSQKTCWYVKTHTHTHTIMAYFAMF